MSTLVIQSKSRNNLKLLRELVQENGDKAVVLSEEDFALGSFMKKMKTCKNVELDQVMKKLRSI